MNIRRATEADVPAIAAIYDAIHTREEAGLTTIGWKRGVYPTAETAMDSVQKGTMYVIEDDNGHVLSAAKIDQNQGDEYARAQWKRATPPERVLVMHTLVVDPAHEGHGLGHNFIHFYEERARSLGCLALRMDTNMRNVAAREMYAKMGFEDAGEVACSFNGIPGVTLMCLEKYLG